MATPSVRMEDVEGRPAAFIRAPHKQLHIWAGRDASGEQRGGWGLTARCVNERGPEGDGSWQAPVVLLAAFQSRLRFSFCFCFFQVFKFNSLNPVLFSCSCTAFADYFKKENKKHSLFTEATYLTFFSLCCGFKHKPEKNRQENFQWK